MNEFKCFFVQLVITYSQRIIYGYKCDLEKLWNDLTNYRRLIVIEENVVECQLKGSIIDELKKTRKQLSKEYSIPCNDC